MFFSIPRFPWFNLSLSFKSNSTPVSECCSPRKTLSRSVKIISVNLCDFCNPGWWKMFAEVKRKLHIRQLIELFTSAPLSCLATTNMARQPIYSQNLSFYIFFLIHFYLYISLGFWFMFKDVESDLGQHEDEGVSRPAWGYEMWLGDLHTGRPCRAWFDQPDDTFALVDLIK